jgi:hypothetical protein
MAHIPEHRKVRNLRRDPRVALSLDADERNAIGMQHNLIIHGTAAALPPDPPPGYVVRIAVDRIGGVGPWTASES